MTLSPLRIRWFAVLTVLVITVVLSACSDSPAPTPAPTATLAPTPTASPAPAPTATPEPTAMLPAGARLSLDEYIAWCSEMALLESDEEDPTYGELSALMAEQIAAIEAVTPPAEVSDWHNGMASAAEPFKDLLDERPPDEVLSGEDDALVAGLFTWLLELSRLEGLLSRGLRDQLIASGCTTGTPDDHGNETISATETEVGSPSIEGTVDYVGDTDFFRFRAEAGQSYLIRLSEYRPGSISAFLELPFSLSMALYDSDGLELESIHEEFEVGMVWEAPSSGDYYVAIGDTEGVDS